MSAEAVAAFRHRFAPARADDALTLLLLHGTGGDENDLLELGRALDGRAALLSPRGQVDEQGANRWFRRLAEGVFDTDDLIARTDQLAAFATGAAAHYRLDPSRLVAVGFSNGANIAAALLLRHPHLLRAAVLFAAMAPLDDPPRGDLSGVGVFLSAGRTDPIAPPEQAELLAEQLVDRGAAVELRWHPGGHGIERRGLAQATAWLGKLRTATSTDPLP
ncbi:alpha/beta hydrolase [Saccharopolyspora rosea]|uniref:Alpha/beta hydrolase n=1 Tax=Saccharopolyspora rosea TaxID=524884 RepID=A0ABW3FN24_9PSEU